MMLNTAPVPILYPPEGSKSTGTSGGGGSGYKWSATARVEVVLHDSRACRLQELDDGIAHADPHTQRVQLIDPIGP